MKRLLKQTLKRFSGLITFLIIGAVAYILSGNISGLLNLIWSFKLLIGPLAIMIILVPFWPAIKGAYGEKIVRVQLSRLDSNQYKVINNVFLKLEGGKTSQIDHVVVSTYGVFVIETKNYSGWIIGDERSEYWTQSFFRSKKRFLNPTWQNYGHIKALKEVLKDLGDIVFIPVVVFSNNACIKKVTSGKVLLLRELLDFIRSSQVETLDEITSDIVYTRLQEITIKDNKEFKEHIKGIKTKVEEKSHVCPKCGSPLIQKQGRYGPFTGCSGYPKCRYIYKGNSIN